MTRIHGPLAHYAERLHRAAGDTHHVASPLGAWLLLALTGPAATGGTRDELTEALGTDVDVAAEVAGALLSAPHPLMASASAVWERQPFEGLAGWRAGLPERTQRGPLPDQAALDAWAREHTYGLIDRFPITVRPQILLILASALATKVSWAEPFQVAPADQLGSGSAWAGRLDRVLRTPWHGHLCWIATTARAGDVAVHAAPARPVSTAGGEAGMLVVSVAAAPDVPPVDVLAAAQEIAARTATAPDGYRPRQRSLFDLPLGDTPLWTLREETVRTFARDGREERTRAVLPCWSAESRHDLTRAGFGFDAAARALGMLMGLANPQHEAVQSAVARYGRYGFEAAAVTAFAVATGLPPEGVARVAELRFGHPYAVVAVATDSAGGPWHGLPVYSAWVAEPQELPEDELADPPRQW
ncbi:serpin family protein [Micromonospora sp. DR5-3]|uniref:hypothetical protein n=1 Tax=unclassified Micromonospora TaxID=2617518 RepID=UPI0011D9D866|nr:MULTISPECIES: hypothetical protein [unclassified Micromonospora]MCW3816664.1 serpin family protein [Micromonospora sp. DR5-3]TYC22994.1 hypothetical protein FXF52_17535 [Micromonospora sp. MP36]